MNNDEVVSVLNDLLETTRDGEYGFRTCGAQCERPQLKGILEARAVDCERAAAELELAVIGLGGTPAGGGTTSGALHRGWVTLRGAVSAVDDLAMLEECESGEDKALAHYREAIALPLPTDVMAMVRRQYEGTKKNHDQIRALRDQMRLAKQ